MKRRTKKMVALAAVAALSLQTTTDVSACDRSGRRVRAVSPVYGGYARAASNYRSTLPTTTPLPSAHVYQAQPVQRVGTSAVVTGASAPNRSPAAVQPRPRQQVAAQTAAAQTVAAQKAATTQTAGATSQPAAKPAATSSPAATADAEASALAALASIADASASASVTTAAVETKPQPAPATRESSSSATAVTGTFRATLPSKLIVELVLASDGTFSWNVSGNDKSTRFSGQYRINGKRLTLVRSNDLQQMAGTLKSTDGGFTFTLDGSNNGGLSFQRS